MARLFLGTGSATILQGDVWTTLTLASRCSSAAGKARCATHKYDALSKTDLTAHVALGDHWVHWVCDEHGPEALEKTA